MNPGLPGNEAGAPMVVNLGLLEHLDRGLEHRLRHGRVYAVLFRVVVC
jgi:hypothetical protein